MTLNYAGGMSYFMKAGEIFRLNKKEIIAVFLPFKKNGSFKNLRLFGSVHKGTDESYSDIDLLVSKGPNYSLKEHLALISEYADFDLPIQVSVEEDVNFKIKSSELLC